MKKIVIFYVSFCILIIAYNRNIGNVNAEEVVIESISDKEVNPWDNRPLIQTTSFQEEYMDAIKLGAFRMPVWDENDSQSLYDTISRCVVRVEMGQYAGSGLVWRMEEEGMVIASNKHLLREAAYGTVTLSDGVSFSAEIMGYSQGYDIGFLLVAREELTSEIFRGCYEARLPEQILEYEENKKIIQVASSQHTAGDFYEGTFLGTKFIPEFQAFMMETKCYAKAGMSGGGVFDEKGLLIGMIAGGDVQEYDSVRESELTYSIPVQDIEKEYQGIRESIE